MNRISHFLTLWIVATISLFVLGCSTTTFMSEGYYITPNLPKSKLATIQIDTHGQWLQQYDRFGMSVNGKRAFHQIIVDTVSIDDVFVLPGKQDISLLLLTPYHRGEANKTVDYYSIHVKAGGTYMLKGELDDDEVWFELIDTDTDQVVSEYKTSRETTYKIEDSINKQSSAIGWGFNF